MAPAGPVLTGSSPRIRILEVAPGATHGLRRAVLRDGRDDAVVVFEGDDEWETVHLAAVEPDQRIVGTVTFLERACPVRPDVFPVRQLRGMAVAADRQGCGVGADLLAAGLDRCRSDGVALVWAHARTAALDFYLANGFTAESDVYIFGDVHLPHRTVVADLA